ncbi:MAG: alpha/beta fold hydrolase, partial [Nocardioidaceae bacterium]
LATVVDELVAPGRAILVGHSMGGMAIMALAEQHPEWFGTRVAGVALISTSAGDLGGVTLGVPGLPGRLLHKATPSVIATAARAPRLVERGRRAGSDLAFALTRRLAFGGPVPPEYVDFTDEMLSATPIEVVADFFPGFDTHDKQRALSVLTEVPTSVISGDEDMLTPLSHGRRIAEEVPSATLLELPGGHMIILERHAEVNEALSELVDKAARA